MILCKYTCQILCKDSGLSLQTLLSTLDFKGNCLLLLSWCLKHQEKPLISFLKSVIFYFKYITQFILCYIFLYILYFYILFYTLFYIYFLYMLCAFAPVLLFVSLRKWHVPSAFLELTDNKKKRLPFMLVGGRM